MGEQLYTPQEVADILKVRKTTVYDMIRKGSLNAVKMGKQFRITEGDLQQVLTTNTSPNRMTEPSPLPVSRIDTFPVEREASSALRNFVVCGQDIVLDMLCSSANSILGSARFLRSYAGSYAGLLALYNEEVQIASAHLWDQVSDTYNLPFIRALMPGEDVRVFHVLTRPVSIYTAAGNPKGILSIDDFARPDVTMVNRERGSGIRVLMDSLFSLRGISTAGINGYNRIVHSHLAAASIISRGGADCSVGTDSAAAQFANVSRVFLRNEQYDLVLRKADENLPEIRTMIAVLQSRQFRDEVGSMGGYDVSDMGRQLL